MQELMRAVNTVRWVDISSGVAALSVLLQSLHEPHAEPQVWKQSQLLIDTDGSFTAVRNC